MSKFTITIEELEDEKLSVDLSEGMTWPKACLMICSTLSNLADTAVDTVFKNLPEAVQTPDTKKDVSGDIADMINYAVSNILNRLSPKDPDLQLSEVAIATMENEIIHYAHSANISMKEAIKHYESQLAKRPYAAKPLGQNAPRSTTDASN